MVLKQMEFVKSKRAKQMNIFDKTFNKSGKGFFHCPQRTKHLISLHHCVIYKTLSILYLIWSLPKRFVCKETVGPEKFIWLLSG